MTQPIIPSDEDAMAAEWVLGVLEGEERAQVETRLKTDAAFAAAVHAWEARLAPMNELYNEVQAPDLLPLIEARLFPTVARQKKVWRGWLMGAVYGTLAAVGVAGFFLLMPLQEPDLVARMASDDASLAYEASFVGNHLTVTRLAGNPAPAGQVHELWIIAPGAAPVSLGLLAEGPLNVDYPVPPKGWVLAVTVEPAGGGPGGVPTGPVILKTEIGI